MNYPYPQPNPRLQSLHPLQLNTPVFKRIGKPVRRRILFLLAGNLLLLAGIWLLLKEGSSFASVLTRASSDVAPIALAGFALTGIIFAGAIDLSIASAIALSGTVFGVLTLQGLPPLPCFLGTLGTAWLIMSLNGVLIAALGVPAIILTLAGLPFYRGVALILAEVGIPGFAGNISVYEDAYHTPGKNFSGWILLLGTLLALLWESFSKNARMTLALGNSEEACRLMGLNPKRILVSAFAVGGIFFGMAALLYVTRIQAVEPARMARGFELQVIAAVILGGTNIFGGEGSYLGTLLGTFFLYFVSQILVYAGASAYLQDAITGGIILLIIGLDCALHRRRKLMEELS